MTDPLLLPPWYSLPDPSLSCNNPISYRANDFDDITLKERQEILRSYLCRRACANLPASRHRAITSANGDLKRDLRVAWHMYNKYREVGYLEGFLLIYGLGDHTLRESDIPQIVESLFTKWTEVAVISDPACSEGQHPVMQLSNILQKYEPEAKAKYTPNPRSGPPYFSDSTLLHNEDMMAILNARGSVLLNKCFQSFPEQLKIVELAMHAQFIWYYWIRAPSRNIWIPQNARLFEDCQLYSYSRSILAERSIHLIRDDVQKHLLNATDMFTRQYRNQQSEHILELKQCVQEWTKKSIDRFCRDKPETQIYFHRQAWRTLMTGCQDRIARRTLHVDKAAKRIQLFHTALNINFNSKSQYLGHPIVHGTKHTYVPREIRVDWMRRNADGFWFSYR